MVCTANVDFDGEQKVWGAHTEFSGDRVEMADVVWAQWVGHSLIISKLTGFSASHMGTPSSLSPFSIPVHSLHQRIPSVCTVLPSSPEAQHSPCLCSHTPGALGEQQDPAHGITFDLTWTQ